MTLSRSRFFPMRVGKKEGFKYEVILGIGGNEGAVKKRFTRLVRHWMRERRVHVTQTSPILRNPPFGYLDQSDFYNAVMRVQTSMDAFSFLRFLHQTEKRFGRVRTFKNAPRTLDLDIIFFDNHVYHRSGLTVPHPHWSERPSVVIPLGLMRS